MAAVRAAISAVSGGPFPAGGGQFLTVYKGKAANTSGIKTYTFKATTASDARILLTRGKASVAEVALKELKK